MIRSTQKRTPPSSRLLLSLLEDQSVATATASVAVGVDGHEGGSTAAGVGALAAETVDLVVVIHLKQTVHTLVACNGERLTR